MCTVTKSRLSLSRSRTIALGRLVFRLIYYFNCGDRCIFIQSSFKRANNSRNLLMQITERGGRGEGKRVIILINYSVGITINARGKVYSSSTADRCEIRFFPPRCFDRRLDKFGFNYLAYAGSRCRPVIRRL